MDRQMAGGRGRGNDKGRGRGHSRRGRTDMGRSEWSRTAADKRARTQATQEAIKRRRLNDEEESLPVYATKFSKEEIEADGKRPKKKVAVMLGYSGSGYKGMQLNHHEKTIEGDLFGAFVAAGAISKANADDPKKSSLVRCARTDRGVHAAGNIISLKMIIEDSDVVKKINEQLSPQIRVWGIERTNGSFSAYQMCDSRIYEYLIPTYCFLPPHPDSFLAKELSTLAQEADDLVNYRERQSEVSEFWDNINENHVEPFLSSLDPELSHSIRKSLHDSEPMTIALQEDIHSAKASDNHEPQVMLTSANDKAPDSKLDTRDSNEQLQTMSKSEWAEAHEIVETNDANSARDEPSTELPQEQSAALPASSKETAPRIPLSPLEVALRQLKDIIIAAKKAYRIHPTRLARIESVLNKYNGTHNFHNYTISKPARDPSAKRVIKSFTIAPDPILINNTEWLSLKVHGQSFMMHQIRKMVTMAAFIVRCGAPESILEESYGHEKLTVPKAPSLGLLLERPVFETYNKKMRFSGGEERGEVGFEKYRVELEEFKQREIYERIFREEERFDTKPDLLYLSSMGTPAAKRAVTDRDNQGESVGQVVAGVSDDDESGDAQGQEG
ncbi:MAG: hypothetical protein Q9222_007846 [Ikaeria aurantiellina]